MKADITTTSAGMIGGVHICERCGKKLHWQDELPKCWCESLIERVARLETAKTIADTCPHIPLPDEERMLKFHEMLHKDHYTINSPAMHIVTPEEHAQAAKEVQAAVQGYKDAIAILNEPAQPEIDWEEVAKSRLTSLKWETLPDHWKHGEIEAAKAAVAEYLRQVKEGWK